MAKFLTLITAVLALTLFFACKKDTVPSGIYFIKMKIDNTDFSFSDSLFAIKQLSSPELQIFGHSKTQGQLQCFFSNFSSGLYTNTYDTSVKKIIYQFTINAIIGYNNNVPLIKQLLRPNPSTSNGIRMEITNVSDAYIEGVFGGVLSNGTTATSTITEGQFKIPFK